MINRVGVKYFSNPSLQSEKANNQVSKTHSQPSADKVTFTSTPSKKKLVDALIQYQSWLSEKVNSLPKGQVEPHKECLKMFNKLLNSPFKRALNSIMAKGSKEEAALNSLSPDKVKEFGSKYSTWLFFTTGKIRDKEVQRPFRENYRKLMDLTSKFYRATDNK